MSTYSHVWVNKLNEECKNKETRAVRAQLPEKNDLYDTDDVKMKEDKLNRQGFTSMKMIDNSLEILSYALEPREFVEINKINDDINALTDATQTNTQTSMKFKEDAKIEDKLEEMSMGSENDLEVPDDEPKEDDIDFLIYKNNLMNDPQHILRYCFDDKTVPLDYSKYGKISRDDVGDCAYCGNKKYFEFQINNNLLNYIDELGDMDWGILAVYSCGKSCFKDGVDYYEETVLVQREVYDQQEEPEAEPEEPVKKAKKKKKNKKAKKPKKQEDQFDPSNWA